MNHNLLTSKITKKEKLCQNIGPYAWQFCFFKMTLLSWFQVPGVFFCMPKTIKSIISWNEFWNETLWLFFTNKKNDENFSPVVPGKKIRNDSNTEEKTLELTNLLAISWMRFLGWSKKAFYSCSSQQQPIDFWLTITR